MGGDTLGECFDAFREGCFHTLEHFIENITIINEFGWVVPERSGLVQDGNIQVQAFLNTETEVIGQIVCALVLLGKSGPFESFKVIVPSKSLNTTTFVSPAVNGIVRFRLRFSRCRDNWIRCRPIMQGARASLSERVVRVTLGTQSLRYTVGGVPIYRGEMTRWPNM
jgi:hypothetical protein